ncbi:MAG: enoyl-CoA hydratase [Pseudomonadota bacterium]
MNERTLETGTEQLLGSVRDHVATLTFNRPEKRNALGDIVTPALRRMLREVDEDPDVRVLVITGAGQAFCSGGDVSGMGSTTDGPARSHQDKVRGLQQKQYELTLRLHEMSMPTIASLPGAAAGAGMSIALACDLRIASETAFLAPGFARVGLSGDYGASWFLNRLVGPAEAKELFFTGRRVQSDEALALGLFNEVVPFDDLANRTHELATQIASGPPIAIRYMKQNIDRASAADLRTCLDWEAERTVTCSATDDHKEAVSSFREKRVPDFQGH